MANNCYFEMKIAGPEAAVNEFMQMLKWEGRFKHCGLGRTFSFDLTCPGEIERDPNSRDIAVVGAGDCAWSVLSSMKDRPGRERSLESETKRLGVAVEYFSSETGYRFQEHGIIVCGQVFEEDSVRYEEYMVEGNSPEAIDAICKEKGLTKEELMASVNHNGDYCVGGYENFGEYSDLFSALQAYRAQDLSTRSLDEAILDAATKAGASIEKNGVLEIDDDLTR